MTSTAPGHDRRGSLIATAVLLVVLGILIVVWTPWHPLPGAVPGGRFPPDAALDFTRSQLARAASYHATIRPWGLAELSLSIVVPAVLGFTPLGARLIGRLSATHRPWLRVLVTVVVLVVVTTIVELPVAARELLIERHYGLTTQGWPAWLADIGRTAAVSCVTTAVAMLALTGLARRLPRRWWVWAAGIGAALVIAGSYVYPFTVQPLFTRTTSLPAGPLRTSLLMLARDDGQPLRDILVAHEGGRTTAENAYVSGFGGSRRLVLYDTLLHDDTAREVRAVTAHELGHAKTHDVVHGTIEAALAVAAAICLAGAALGRGGRGDGPTGRLGSAGPGDPRVVPLLLAAYVTVSFVTSPLVDLVSRHVEARADVHSLTLDRDPTGFVTSQRKLAVSGLDDLAPDGVLYVLFFGHPSTPQRIATARDWARQHNVPVPSSVTGATVVPLAP